MTDGERNLIRGALVEWTMGNGYGVIVAVDERLITVRWDEEGIPTQFAARNPPLSRVDLMGKPVFRRSTGEDVSVPNPVAGAMPVWRCRIYPQSGSPTMSNVAEEDLRPLPITDPIERFQIGDCQGRRQNCTTGVMPDGHGLAGWAGGLAWSGAGAGLGRALIGGWPIRRWR